MGKSDLRNNFFHWIFLFRNHIIIILCTCHLSWNLSCLAFAQCVCLTLASYWLRSPYPLISPSTWKTTIGTTDRDRNTKVILIWYSSDDHWLQYSPFLSLFPALTKAFRSINQFLIPPFFFEGWLCLSHFQHRELWNDKLGASLKDLNYERADFSYLFSL